MFIFHVFISFLDLYLPSPCRAKGNSKTKRLVVYFERNLMITEIPRQKHLMLKFINLVRVVREDFQRES